MNPEATVGFAYDTSCNNNNMASIVTGVPTGLATEGVLRLICMYTGGDVFTEIGGAYFWRTIQDTDFSDHRS